MRRPCIRVDGANSGRHGVRTASIVARIVLHHPGVELSQRRNCLSREAFPAFCTLHLLYIMRSVRDCCPTMQVTPMRSKFPESFPAGRS
jgi:hypothetical protein